MATQSTPHNSILKSLARKVMTGLLRKLYRVEIKGIENLPSSPDEKLLVICNHQSFLDAAILSLFMPIPLTFAVNKFVAERKLIKFFLSFSKVVPVDTSTPLAMKELVDCVKAGENVMIFPEGRITVTGTLMKFYDGPAMIADKAHASILPVIIDGAEFSTLSKMKGKLPVTWFPKVTLTIFPPVKPEHHESANAKERRAQTTEDVYDLMCEYNCRTKRVEPLFTTLARAAKTYGKNRTIMQDISRTELSYKALVLKSLVLGDYLAGITKRSENVGLLMPNSNAAVVSFFAIQAFGRVPAMLNFTTGEANLKLAAESAQVKTIITSRKFIEASKMEELITFLEKQFNILYLEDVAAKISPLKKLQYLALSTFASIEFLAKNSEQNTNNPAVIMFTSGSEGTPKGVVLSHRNIISNRNQMLSRVDFGSYDVMFNALPMFHSFGLLVGTILPVISGIRTFLYPSPLHYRIIPEVVYDCGATIMFGTDTFLSRYAKYAHPYDFRSLRYIFAGAEKLREDTRTTYMEKFGVRILEGYGVTETSPVLSVNTAIENKAGTVGKLMPGVKHKIIPVEGITGGGRLYVSGDNVMIGYLRHENPGVIENLVSEAGEGWHDTGDIVEMDSQGFVTIKGRAKRFAKIGGEMVSLTFVEGLVNKLWPLATNAIISQPDQKKGEQLILFTTQEDADASALLQFAQKEGAPELFVPRKLIYMKELPVLGTGKVDYKALGVLSS